MVVGVGGALLCFEYLDGASVGLHIDWCANLMLLALVRTVCVKKPNSFGGGFCSVKFAVPPIV